ncbi:mRNA-capping enzyme-like [Chelonus insularis]|uniref:mRNA-capping enzyme-like n=1 Tax=Chelonus insularis TaxID=460826 RepID=UPI00158EF5B8|nr:mRNA-capping enzyme-like [Chelonus insularis]
MSSWSAENSKGIIPPRWLHCPRKSIGLINNKFLAFKTPLSEAFNSQVSEECRFSVNMLFASLKSQRLKMGLLIDLTNTNRFYNKADVEAHSCHYYKLQCRGHGETPTIKQTKVFIEICKNFIAQNPSEIIGVHCTHGFNRTGFLLISYLIESGTFNLDAAVNEFSSIRPPGIYKEDYIKELYRRYDDESYAPPAPPSPAWCLEYDDSRGDEKEHEQFGSRKHTRRRKEHIVKNPVFMAGVPGVVPVQDLVKVAGIQKRVQEMCQWNRNGFPGSQPVSMDWENIVLLNIKPYRVSWKADGTRYMMLIQADNEVFFIDRDNSVFQVSGLVFPHPRDLSRNLKDTLLDGEMVIDKANGTEYPRYLVYDVIMYDGNDVSKKSFFPDRYTIIEREVMGGRYRALKESRIYREQEPFSVRQKQFWDITQVNSLLSEKFTKQLGHEPDGLIFQPSKEPYISGTAAEVLKWKPLSLNSVDFKLKIVVESGMGIVPRKIGHLYVGGLKKPFDYIKITTEIKDLNNKIIECKFENGHWVFMRQRTDKSFPNSFTTAQSVCQSIRAPVTSEDLCDYIEKYKFKDDSDCLPPPYKRRR